MGEGVCDTAHVTARCAATAPVPLCRGPGPSRCGGRATYISICRPRWAGRTGGAEQGTAAATHTHNSNNTHRYVVGLDAWKDGWLDAWMSQVDRARLISMSSVRPPPAMPAAPPLVLRRASASPPACFPKAKPRAACSAPSPARAARDVRCTIASAWTTALRLPLSHSPSPPGRTIPPVRFAEPPLSRGGSSSAGAAGRMVVVADHFVPLPRLRLMRRPRRRWEGKEGPRHVAGRLFHTAWEP